MTPRRHRRVSVPKSKKSDYIRVAENFYKGAEAAKEFDYSNAAGRAAGWVHIITFG